MGYETLLEQIKAICAWKIINGNGNALENQGENFVAASFENKTIKIYMIIFTHNPECITTY